MCEVLNTMPRNEGLLRLEMVAPGEFLHWQGTPLDLNVGDSPLAEGREAFLFYPIITNCFSYLPCPQYAQISI